ncbi:MAG TPA: ImmA/IrrE family metallo-endopeptidase, partial [Patescibacteria group bacterium]|nr:ImmA/IrrE family metallo-endopeptidase [Patescibacteria group bacterium]
CNYLGIELIEDDLGETGKVSGCLIQENDSAAVLINVHIAYYGRKRFTIGHEIGHFCIPWHVKTEYECRTADIETFKSDKEEEYEANVFASELLFPTKDAVEILKKREVSIQLSKDIAEEYGLSLCAAARKLVEKTEYDSCAIALSQNNTCLWRIRSPKFLKQGLDIRSRGIVLPSVILDSKTKGHVANWIIGDRAKNIPHIWEEHVDFSRLNMVLSLISVPDNSTDDGDEFEEDDY